MALRREIHTWDAEGTEYIVHVPPEGIVEGCDVFNFVLPRGVNAGVPCVLFYFPFEGTPLHLIPDEDTTTRLLADIGGRYPLLAATIVPLVEAFDATFNPDGTDAGPEPPESGS